MNRRDFLLTSLAALAATGAARAAEVPRVGVVCFSRSGNTRAVAEGIARAFGARVLALTPAEAYPADYDTATARSREELHRGRHVALAPYALGDYGVLFVGSPNWWGTVAPPVRAFLREANLRGRRVVPFFTHGGGGMQRCGRDARRLIEAAGGIALPAATFPGGAVSMDAVAAWARGLDLAAVPATLPPGVALGPFPLGQPNLANARFFSGRSWVAPLTSLPALGCAVDNVTFEPGCRNRWHRHPGGQLLLCVGGEGRYQERVAYRRPGRVLRPGDVVEVAPGVERWHGAAPDRWFAHLAVDCAPGKGKTEWLEAVAQEEYASINQEAGD